MPFGLASDASKALVCTKKAQEYLDGVSGHAAGLNNERLFFPQATISGSRASSKNSWTHTLRRDL